jgi:hypothetical protein
MSRRYEMKIEARKMKSEARSQASPEVPSGTRTNVPAKDYYDYYEN